MDALAALMASPTRADLLEALFAAPARVWRPAELARAAGGLRQVASRELKRLAAAGVVEMTLLDGARAYKIDPTDPVTRELARYVQQTRGRVPRIRAALRELRSPTLAWTTSLIRAADGGVEAVLSEGRRPPGPRGQVVELVVLTGAPRSLVLVQLADMTRDDIRVQCMSVREWLARLEKGDVALRRCRRARKLWVLGNWSELVTREQAELERRTTMATVLRDWREELSDEWDEEWDPVAAVAGDALLARSASSG